MTDRYTDLNYVICCFWNKPVLYRSVPLFAIARCYSIATREQEAFGP